MVGAVAVLLALVFVAGACSSGRGSDAAPGDTTADTAENASGDLRRHGVAVRRRVTPRAPTAQGVTADSITIGYGDDAGYQAPPASTTRCPTP